MRFDRLNRTFDNDRDGISTCGARPRSADWITESARLRIEPRVFLSFAERFAVSADLIEQTPFLLLGSLEQIVDKLERLRQDVGISHVVVRDAEGFAPVVAALAGR